jgi:hypothetical protein
MEDFETLRKAVPATALFLAYMDPLCHVSRGKTGEGETGKRDYRNLWRVGYMEHSALWADSWNIPPFLRDQLVERLRYRCPV